ncbi:YajG family lipoprotein [Rhodanobacter caeni]|uniref:Flagellar biosynthesis protein n=1 Tax=Rhodanobacter caeni TaxID=657654 RepID=A0ABN0U6V5_9GAMM
MKHLVHGLIAAFILALTSGCATTRTTMSLDVPAPGSAVVSGGKPVVIDAVRDVRVFEIDPANPSTPSLKKGASYALDATQRKQAIARKRGGFGKAFGDILLPPGENVESLTRQLLTNALASRGYSVLDAANAPADAPHVSVDIREFWAWFTPGFWAASIEAKLDTLLKIDSPQGQRQVAVKGYGRNSIQVAREANWQLAYQRAFEDYLKQFAEAATNNGL